MTTQAFFTAAIFAACLAAITPSSAHAGVKIYVVPSGSDDNGGGGHGGHGREAGRPDRQGLAGFAAGEVAGTGPHATSFRRSP